MKTFLISLCLVSALALLVWITACAGQKTSVAGKLLPESDDPAVIEQQYRETYAKWQSRNLRTYTLELTYGAFSPFAGPWEIDVVDARVARCVFRGEVLAADATPLMQNITMERLYEMAKDATRARGNTPFIIQASFYRDGGVASIRRIKNPAAATTVPRDATCAYEISDIQTAQ
jgi:hypothetical protein